jgi:hypothetical protein
MLIMRLIKIASFIAALLIGNLAYAGIITFNDRAAFDSYVGSGISVDDLNGDTIAPHKQSSFIRSNYTVNGSMFGCVDGAGCTGPYTNMDDDYIWTYVDVTFDFDVGISAFGLDFNSYNSKMSSLSYIASLNGYMSNSSLLGGFFGIASDDGSSFTSVVYGKNTAFGLFDNVTYSQTTFALSTSASDSPTTYPVPEPSVIALLAIGVLGIGLVRRRNYS